MVFLAIIDSIFGTNFASENAGPQHSARNQAWSDISMGGQSRAHFGDNYHYTYAHPPEPPKSKRLLEIQAWLGGTRNQSSQYEDIGMPVAGVWLLIDKRFRTWQTEPNSWFWLYGIPGCGKTVLNAKAVRYLRKRWESKSGVVVHFYFDFRARQNDVDFMLRSLVLQLLDHSHDILPQMEQLFERSCGSGARQPTSGELLEMLRLALTVKDNVYIVLDALDECDSAEDQHLETALAQMHRWNLQGARFLITSQRDGFTNSALEDTVSAQHQVPVRQQNVDSDIDAWVEEQLSSRGKLGRKLSKWDQQDSLKSRIKSGLLQKASGMFLLPKLQVKELEECHNVRDVEQALLAMPDTLGAMYDRILGKISSDTRRRYARDILMWLAFTRRPLYVHEIEWVIAFSLDERYSMTIDPNKRLQNGSAEIFRICHSLVGLLDESLTNSGERSASSLKVELAHSTVKDHIASFRRTPPSWLGNLLSGPSHCSIAQSLVVYLEYLARYRWDNLQTARWSREFSLAYYAVHVWPEHATLAAASLDNSLQVHRMHYQIRRLVSNRDALEMLIRVFEPHRARGFQVLDKAVQDLKLVWHYTSHMRLGRMVQMSIPPQRDVGLPALGPGRVRETRWTVGQKLGLASEVHIDAVWQDDWMHQYRDRMQTSNWTQQNWGRQMWWQRDLFEDWKKKVFLDLDSAMRDVPPDGKMTSCWDDSGLAVAVVKFDCPGRLPLESQLPVVIHVPFLETAKQAPVLDEGDLRKPAES